MCSISNGRRFAASWLLLLIPLGMVSGWWAVRQPDRMAPRKLPLSLETLWYDEYDLSAMALRGLNAELGRQAGAASPPPRVPYESFSKAIEAPRALRARYFLEYPHAVLVLFRAGYWIQPAWREVSLPPALPDAAYHNIASHDPETDDQFRVWRVFAKASAFYSGVMAAAWLVLIVVLEWLYPASWRGGSFLLCLPAAVFFTLNRFDVLPALCTALCLAALAHHRWSWAGIALGVGTLLKAYPILFAPLILRYLWPHRQQLLRFGSAYTLTTSLALAPLLFGADFAAVIAPYRYQLFRPPEFGMTIYGCLLPIDLAEGWIGSAFRWSAMGGTMLAALATPIRSLPSLLRRSALVLAGVVCLAVFYSPQWVLWFVPFVAPLVRQDTSLRWTAISLDGVNYLTFPIWFWVLPAVGIWLGYADREFDPWLIQIGNFLRLSRFLIVGALIARLLYADWGIGWRSGHYPVEVGSLPVSRS